MVFLEKKMALSGVSWREMTILEFFWILGQKSTPMKFYGISRQETPLDAIFDSGWKIWKITIMVKNQPQWFFLPFRVKKRH